MGTTDVDNYFEVEANRILQLQSPMESDTSKIPGASTKAATNDKVDDAAKKKKPLLSKSLICKLLAEFVRSYAGCAKLVTEHHYSAGSNEKITEVR